MAKPGKTQSKIERIHQYVQELTESHQAEVLDEVLDFVEERAAVANRHSIEDRVMTVTERIHQYVQELTESHQAEVLDFVEYLLLEVERGTARLNRDPENCNDPREARMEARRLFEKDHYEKAEIWATRAIELAPDHSDTRMLMARILLFQDKFEEALKEVDKAISLGHDSGDALFWKGKILIEARFAFVG